MVSNNTVIAIFGLAIIFLTVSLILHSSLMLGSRTSATTDIKTDIKTVTGSYQGEVNTTTRSNGAASIATSIATSIAATTLSCHIDYEAWQGACLRSFPGGGADPTSAFFYASCPSGSDVAAADTDEDNARIQSFIDYKGPGEYYINLFFGSSDGWKVRKGLKFREPVKKYWSVDEPKTGAKNAVMQFRRNGLWFTSISTSNTIICRQNF